MAKRRTYKVHFECWIDGEWNQNWSHRVVVVTGGAESAIKEAIRREGKNGKDLRAIEVDLIATED